MPVSSSVCLSLWPSSVGPGQLAALLPEGDWLQEETLGAGASVGVKGMELLALGKGEAEGGGVWAGRVLTLLLLLLPVGLCWTRLDTRQRSCPLEGTCEGLPPALSRGARSMLPHTSAPRKSASGTDSGAMSAGKSVGSGTSGASCCGVAPAGDGGPRGEPFCRAGLLPPTLRCSSWAG